MTPIRPLLSLVLACLLPQLLLAHPRPVFPSEDPVLSDFHSLGDLGEGTKVFRSASPVRDLVSLPDSRSADARALANAQTLDRAKARLERFRSRGIRTILSLEDAGRSETGKTRASVALEKAAAESLGIRFIAHPLANSGPNSLQSMSHDDVKKFLERASADIFKYGRDGGIVIHCAGGHDRTGLLAAYLRVRYQNWSVSRAIEEMRRYGLNRDKYTLARGDLTWHELHLMAVAKKHEKDRK